MSTSINLGEKASSVRAKLGLGANDYYSVWRTMQASNFRSTPVFREEEGKMEKEGQSELGVSMQEEAGIKLAEDRHGLR